MPAAKKSNADESNDSVLNGVRQLNLFNGKEDRAKISIAEEALAEINQQTKKSSTTINQGALDDSDSKDPRWQKTINKVVKSIVSIHFTHVDGFDTSVGGRFEASGFIVDSKAGIILTNKHVVGPGPFIGYAIFNNHEEADLKPLYRDPIHDFGFLQFNTKDIKYMELLELDLRPDLAKVGSEIKVIGNDSGEQLSILTGVIARLDRNAPFYGFMEPSDFNTEYIQAAASASGGSSGSPVIDIEGNAVALQAGGKFLSATNFFSPVYRALRALRCLQNNQPITRGTIQVQWKLESYSFAKKLGLTAETEDLLRNKFPSINGVLVCAICLSEGPSDGLIKEGDCLISINGQLISTFITVDEILDSNVGKEVEILVQRTGEDLVVKCVVQDLYSITPSRYLKVCGSVFNEIGFQVALPFGLPVKGVIISSGGCCFEEFSDSIVDSIDGIPTPDLDSFIEAMKQIPNKSYVVLKYRSVYASDKSSISCEVFVNKDWSYDLKLATYNNDTGLMDFTYIPSEKKSIVPLTPKVVKFVDLPVEEVNLKTISRYFVTFKLHCFDFLMDFPGNGLVIDSENGFAILYDYKPSNDMLDIFLQFADCVRLPAKVVFVHPAKSYFIVKYDPSLILPAFPSPKFTDKHLEKDDKVSLICSTSGGDLTVSKNKVTNIEFGGVDQSSMNPKVRIDLDRDQMDFGLLVDSDTGTFRACGYDNYVDFSDILWELKFLKQENIPPSVRFIDAVFVDVNVLFARMNGVPDEWLTKIEDKCVGKVRLWSVAEVSIGLDGQPSCALKRDDIVLSINSKTMTSPRDIETAIKDLDLDQDHIQLEVVRDKKVLQLDVKLANSITGDYMISKIITWSGARLQAPDDYYRKFAMRLPSLVLCSSAVLGSPADVCDISGSSFITHLNEVPTPTLEAFVEVVKTIPDNTFCKLRVVSDINVPELKVLKVNYHYFPTEVMTRNSDGEWTVETL